MSKAKSSTVAPLGQLAYVAVGRKDEYLARRGFGVEALGQRVGRIFEHLAQPSQPLVGTHAALLDTLVPPVRRDAALGHLVHALGAYLYLHPAAVAVGNGGVQRLVSVGFRYRDPVAHTVGVGRVDAAYVGVDCPAERLFALGLAVDDDAQCEDIVHALERHVLLAHLLEYRKDRLGAALDVILYAVGVEAFEHRRDEFGDEGATLALGLLQLADYMTVGFGFEILQRQVFQLALDVVQSQLVGYLSI